MFKLFNFNNSYNKISYKIFKLNIIIISFFILVFIKIFVFIIVSVFLHRKKLKNNKFKFYKNYVFEILWFLIPLNFLMLVFFFSSKIILDYRKKNNIYTTIKIISYQWKWYFNYITGYEKGINYFSNIGNNILEIINYLKINKLYLQIVDNNLILPAKKTIRFIFTSNDVIHSFYIPSLIIKQDCIPGFIKDFYFKSEKVGKYIGFCTELCGKNHSYMPIVLNFIRLKDYKKWIISKLFEKHINLNLF